RARFKAYVSDHVSLDPVSLPYRTEVLDFLKRERMTRQSIVLATAAHRRIADSVAAHLRVFDSVIASDAGHNTKGDGKLGSIRAHIGPSEFDYVGDSMADVPVFRAARRSYLVCPEPALTAALRVGCRVETVFPSEAATGQAGTH